MKKILVVDDNDDLKEMFELIFTMNKYDVKSATLKIDVFELILSFKPQVILIDVFLGKEDGREICREIKAMHTHIPVILMSANAKLLLNHEECDADAVIEKPFDVPVLLDKINSFV